MTGIISIEYATSHECTECFNIFFLFSCNIYLRVLKSRGVSVHTLMASLPYLHIL
jgi:hypothetical protein